MMDRCFRLLLGMALLVLLYLDSRTGMAVLIAYLVFEGVTNWRIPILTKRYFSGGDDSACDVLPLKVSSPARVSFEAERALRLVLALILALSLYIYPESFWWMSWFVAFTVTGAGISGVCPMLASLRMPGFR
jgi:hypothetical protein